MCFNLFLTFSFTALSTNNPNKTVVYEKKEENRNRKVELFM